MTHLWRVKKAGGTVIFEYTGESAVIVLEQNGIVHCHSLSQTTQTLSSQSHFSNSLSLNWAMIPPEGLPHPTDVAAHGFFTQQGSACGIPIYAYPCVDDACSSIAATVLTNMLSGVSPAIIHRMIILGAAVGIIGRQQCTSDIPQYAHLKGKKSSDGRSFDDSIRGLGGALACGMTTVGEENLLMKNGDSRYSSESILCHEFAHAVMNLGLTGTQTGRDIDTAFRSVWKRPAQYKRKHRKSYMLSNADEYWAEGTQAWFEATVRMDVTAEMKTRVAVKERDPMLAVLLERVWGDGSWRYLHTAPAGTFSD